MQTFPANDRTNLTLKRINPLIKGMNKAHIFNDTHESTEDLIMHLMRCVDILDDDGEMKILEQAIDDIRLLQEKLEDIGTE